MPRWAGCAGRLSHRSSLFVSVSLFLCVISVISVISVLYVTISSTTLPVALLAGWCGRCWKPKAPG
jgi:hypothetical protein